MKKTLSALFLLGFCTAAWATNSHQLGSEARERQAWFYDAHLPYVVSGCQPSVPSSSLAIGSFACAAYVSDGTDELTYVSETSGITVSDSATLCLGITKDRTSAISGWTRQSLTHFMYQAAACSSITDVGNLLEFAEVTVAGSVITAIRNFAFRSPEDAALRRHNVRSWGATGDGSTDDTTAIQNAFNALPNQGGYIYVPEGNYVISSTIQAPDDGTGFVHPFILEGESASMPAGSTGVEAGISIFNCQQASGGCLDLQGTGDDDQWSGVIRNMNFVGEDTAGTVGILAADLKRATFDDVTIKDFAINFQVAGDYYYTVWRRVRILSATGDGMSMVGLANNALISDSLFTSNGDDGLYTEESGDNLIVIDSYFESNGGYGHNANGFLRLTLKDNYYEQNGGSLGSNEAEIKISDGGSTGPSGLTLDGNHFLSSGSYTQAVFMDFDGDWVTLTNNHFKDDDYTYAIGFSDGSDSIYLTAYNNRSYGAGTTQTQLVENTQQILAGAAFADQLAFEETGSYNWIFRGNDSTQDAVLELETTATAVSDPLLRLNSRSGTFTSDILHINQRIAASSTYNMIAGQTGDDATDSFYHRGDGLFYTAPIATAPATCSIGMWYVDTSGAYCTCSATNTWTNTNGVGSCA